MEGRWIQITYYSIVECVYHIKQKLILEVQQVPALLQILHFLSLAHKFLHVLPLQDQKKGPAPHDLTLVLFEDSRNRVSVEAKGHSMNTRMKVCGHYVVDCTPI